MNKGFTIIELLLVVAIIFIVTSFSAVFYSRFLTQNAVLNTTDQIVGQLQKAQIYAMSGKQNSNWGVSYASPLLILYAGNSYATRNPIFDEKFTVNGNISIAGLLSLTFTRVTGTPSATPVITISGNNNTKMVTLNSQGMINK